MNNWGNILPTAVSDFRTLPCMLHLRPLQAPGLRASAADVRARQLGAVRPQRDQVQGPPEEQHVRLGAVDLVASIAR